MIFSDSLQKQQIDKILHEIETHGGLLQWMDELALFRDAFAKYNAEMRYVNFYGEHQEDHHGLGYYAPLDWKYVGFDGIIRTPAEQIIELAKIFKMHNIHFIYVALPCKAAIYTHYYISSEFIPKDGIVIPQWRKMLLEIMLAGVEVVDMFPIFLEHKRAERPLYLESHMWGPYAAELTAAETAKHLSHCFGTTEFRRKRYTAFYKFDWFQNYRQILVNGVEKDTSGISTSVATFGNCNNFQFFSFDKAIPKNCKSIPADFASLLSYEIKNHVKLLGRYLPFSKNEGVGLFPPGSLAGIKTILYVGFPSASYVRPVFDKRDCWCTQRIPEQAFY